MGQQQCKWVSLPSDSAEDLVSSDIDDELGGHCSAHAREVSKKVAALADKYGWATDPEVQQALSQTDLPSYRRILEHHRSAEPRWDEAVHGSFSGDRRVQSLALGGFVFENLSVYTVLVQLLHPAMVQSHGHPPRVLDVGCGTGFLTAVLARLVAPRRGSVVAIDLFVRQVEHAQRTMSACYPELLPYVSFAVANGLDYRDPLGLPFDAIAVACQATEVPQGLVRQLAPGGRLVAPVGRPQQHEDPTGRARPHHKYWLVQKDAFGSVVYSGRAGPISVNFVPLLPSSPLKQPTQSPCPVPLAAPDHGRRSACPTAAVDTPPRATPVATVAMPGKRPTVHGAPLSLRAAGSMHSANTVPLGVQPGMACAVGAWSVGQPLNSIQQRPLVGR